MNCTRCHQFHYSRRYKQCQKCRDRNKDNKERHERRHDDETYDSGLNEVEDREILELEQKMTADWKRILDNEIALMEAGYGA